MSTNQITQYFGPHARRWTSPATGEVLSLSPRDYETMVNTQMELDNMDRELAEAEKALAAAPRLKLHAPDPLAGARIWLGRPEHGGEVPYPNPTPAASLPRQDRPVGRHFKRRKLRRAAAALVLVYVIFIIGATLVVGAL